jgi:hypothetical protein
VSCTAYCPYPCACVGVPSSGCRGRYPLLVLLPLGTGGRWGVSVPRLALRPVRVVLPGRPSSLAPPLSRLLWVPGRTAGSSRRVVERLSVGGWRSICRQPTHVPLFMCVCVLSSPPYWRRCESWGRVSLSPMEVFLPGVSSRLGACLRLSPRCSEARVDAGASRVVYLYSLKPSARGRLCRSLKSGYLCLLPHSCLGSSRMV